MDSGNRLRKASAALVAIVVGLCCIVGSAQAASPRWELVGVTGPTVLPPRQSEVQRIAIDAEGGEYTLTATPATGAGTLSFAQDSAFLPPAGATELSFFAAPSGQFEEGQRLTGTGIATGTTITHVSANGRTITLSLPTTAGGSFATLTGASRQVTGVTTSAGAFAAGQMISATGIPAGTTIESVAPGTLTLSDFPTSGGTQTLTATATTAPIAFDSEAATVEAALDALPGLTVTVTGGPGDKGAEHPYFVSFGGSLAYTDVVPMTADGTALTGGLNHVALVSTVLDGGLGTGEIAVYPRNLGGATSSAPATLTVDLPLGIVTSATPAGPEAGQWNCMPSGSEQSTVSCETTLTARAGMSLPPLVVPVSVEATAAPESSAQLEITGGASSSAVSVPVTVSATPAPPGIQYLRAASYDDEGGLETRAGAHPASASAAFFVNTVRSPLGAIVPAGEPKDIDVELPPGFIGNPLAVPRCPRTATAPSECSPNSMVGVAETIFGTFAAGQTKPERVFDLEPPTGSPAGFRFWAALNEEEINILGSLRSDGDYGITVSSPNTPQVLHVFGAFVTFWGAPASAVHDNERCEELESEKRCVASEVGEEAAFLANPSDCALEATVLPQANLLMTSWTGGASIFEATERLPAVGECAALISAPTFRFSPTGTEAAVPAAYTAELGMPQAGLDEYSKRAEPPLKKAVVTLPKGVNVNPSSANGMEACSETQMGLVTIEGAAPNPIRFDKSEPTCPDASKLGTVEARSPLLEETLEGTIYLAAQEENPFHSLLALYLVLNDPKDGIIVKLPGEVKPDPNTGQLTATFDNNPQLPVEDLKLNFRGGGPRSPLSTPAVCGTYTTHGEWTPWSAPESGPPAQTEDGFQVTSGPGGGACATSESGLPFSPSFEAGTTSTQAGAYAPLVVKLARKDGEQELTHLEFTLPKGLTGKLAGIPYCSDQAIREAEGKAGKAEQANSSCPGASELGTVDTSAGVGSEPIHVGGKVYLAGPYEGAPLSSVVITPAVAGPFDLGTVVVRAPLFVNPETAQITAKSDEIPHILKGIPLQIRSVEIKVSRQDFTLNPTSCEPMSVTSGMGGLNGGSASPQSRFQVGNCGNLPFKPALKLQLKGATGRTGHPGLKAVLTAKPGEANIGRAQVNLPHGEFLDQGNLNKTCTKPVLLAGNCPKSTVYGKAKAWTPLLAEPLQGPVYLVGGYGYKLPALVADLNGQVRIVLAGKVDSGPNKGIRNTFEAVPDAPVSRFVLEMKGGKKYGLLENSENLCRAKKSKRRAIVRFTGQNNKVHQFKPVVANQCKGKKKQKSSKHKRVASSRILRPGLW